MRFTNKKEILISKKNMATVKFTIVEVERNEEVIKDAYVMLYRKGKKRKHNYNVKCGSTYIIPLKFKEKEQKQIKKYADEIIREIYQEPEKYFDAEF